MRAPHGTLGLAAAFALLACSSQPDRPSPVEPEKPGDTTSTALPDGARLILESRLIEVNQGRTAALVARVVDAAGAPLTGVRLAFSAPGGAPLSVSSDGVITGLRPGAGLVHVSANDRKVDSVNVDVFGRPEGLVAGSFALGARPFGAAVSRAGVVYVTRLDAAALAVTDVRSRAEAGSIEVGSVPTGVTFDAAGERAYVTNQYSGNVGVVDVASGRQVATIDVPGAPFVVRVAPSGTKLYVTSNANVVTIVDRATGQRADSIPVGDAPNSFAVSPDEKRLYVASAFGSSVAEIDPETDAVMRRFVVDGIPQDMIVSKKGDELYVANEAGWVDVISLETGARLAHIELAGGGFGMAQSPDQVHLYVSVPSRGVVQVVNTESRRITHTIEVGGTPRRIAFDYHGGMAVVANESGAVHFVR